MGKDSLMEEANFIHQKLYGFFPAEDLKHQYAEVHKSYAKYIDGRQQETVVKLIAGKVDIISLEFFWRLKNKNNLLSQKILILFYLTEVRPEYQERFLSLKNDGFAFWKLAYYTVISILRFFKGGFLYSLLRIAN